MIKKKYVDKYINKQTKKKKKPETGDNEWLAYGYGALRECGDLIFSALQRQDPKPK